MCREKSRVGFDSWGGGIRVCLNFKRYIKRQIVLLNYFNSNHGKAPAMLVSPLRLLAVPLFLALGLRAAWTDPVHIVAFGDSNTAGFRLLNKNTYPSQLERALREKGYDVRVLNSGISGETSSMGLKRFDRAIPPGTDIAIV